MGVPLFVLACERKWELISTRPFEIHCLSFAIDMGDSLGLRRLWVQRTRRPFEGNGCMILRWTLGHRWLSTSSVRTCVEIESESRFGVAVASSCAFCWRICVDCPCLILFESLNFAYLFDRSFWWRCSSHGYRNSGCWCRRSWSSWNCSLQLITLLSKMAQRWRFPQWGYLWWW